MDSKSTATVEVVGEKKFKLVKSSFTCKEFILFSYLSSIHLQIMSSESLLISIIRYFPSTKCSNPIPFSWSTYNN